MTRIFSFPPISGADAQVLILGSMPGVASLRLQQYYGHPQNAFWKILGEILGFDAAGSYAQRTAVLVARKLALWDVMAACVREGSLDSSIDGSSIEPNDFAAFFARHPHVRRVCFNGITAQSAYNKHVLPRRVTGQTIEYVRLPSTSPAHAGMPLAAKALAWRAVSLGFSEDGR
jgi:TDG/mug DNA glycosylase family protein